MKKRYLRDAAFSAAVLALTFLTNMLLQHWFNTRTLVPMIFVLGVFLVAWRTEGYVFGIISSLLSVLAVNYAFTYPYYAFDLISPECVSSAIVMLIVSTLTGTLTTQLKHQQKIKAEAERERLRSDLLRAVSHDLRTPLTSIYGACSTVIENYDSLTREQQLKLLREVRADSEWLTHMVENLLSVTRIDGEGVCLAKTPTVLEELIDTVLVKARKRWPELPIQVDIPEEFITIAMDPMLMEQVLLNLIENAVIHARGMTMLRLQVRCEDGTAVFSVSDDGCGLAPERLERLFVGHLPPAQLPADGRRRSMGIGLSVCAAIVQAHGGRIWAENLRPHGVQFTFLLEMEDSHEQQPL